MGSTTSNRSARRQSGQALVLGLLLIVIASFLLLSVFSSGRVLATRQSLNDTADAAALSAATWRARALNYIAYTNRAIVAQEVALAQAVTIASWSRYFESLADNLETVSSTYPPAAMLMSAVSAGASAGRESAERTAHAELAWRADEQTGYKVWLERSQSWLLRSAEVFALGAIANEVARASDPRFFAFALGDGGAFAGFTRRYESQEDRARLREVVLASLDSFTGQNRSADQRLPLPSSCVGRSVDLDKWTLWLRRRGGTGLHESLETWSAIDTLSLHDWSPGGFLGLGGCRDREAIPLGWGAQGNSLAWNPAQTQSAQNNPTGTALATLSEAPQPSGLAGLASIRDLHEQSTQSESAAVSRLAVLARAELVDARTADSLGVGAERLRLRDGSGSSRLWALSAAEVYFSPPPEPSTPAQRPSLFSPFWQARLIQPTEAQRAAAESYVR